MSLRRIDRKVEKVLSDFVVAGPREFVDFREKSSLPTYGCADQIMQ